MRPSYIAARVLDPIRTAARRRAAIELAAATAFAALTAVGARLQFHLPFTPVPVTGQVFCVLLAGAVLGARLGFVSQVEYLAAGAAGLPVFAHGGGMAALLGPTGGYLIGFPIAAAVVGALAHPSPPPSAPPLQAWRGGKGGEGRGGPARALTFLACLSGVAVIYLFGAAWYAVWAVFTAGAAGLAAVLAQSVFPFVLADVAKAALAAAAAPGVRRRMSVG
jgi:biotin transport system substrate-specific component